MHGSRDGYAAKSWHLFCKLGCQAVTENIGKHQLHTCCYFEEVILADIHMRAFFRERASKVLKLLDLQRAQDWRLGLVPEITGLNQMMKMPNAQ